jgi:hypothetical protein
VPLYQRVHVDQDDLVRQPSGLYCFHGKPGRCDDVTTESFLFFNHALELLNDRTTDLVLGRVSLALYDHQAFRMDRKPGFPQRCSRLEAQDTEYQLEQANRRTGEAPNTRLPSARRGC